MISTDLFTASEKVYSLRNALDIRQERTPAQREALITDCEYNTIIPSRGATIGELAEALDISITAVSGRLRRGTSTLNRRTLL